MMKTGWLTRTLEFFNPRWRSVVLVSLVTLLAALPGVFSMPVLDRDEARYAQATAQMLESRDWIEIRFMDEARNKKPVGIYWMQAASVSLLSSVEARDIWAYRLPSVLGALIAAIATLLAGRALLGYRAGLAAGLLIGATIILGVEGGIAKTDAMLAGMTALAFLSLVKVRLQSEASLSLAYIPDRVKALPAEAPVYSWVWATLGWVAVAIGALIKGPIAPLTMGLAVITLSLWERRIGWWKAYLIPLGPILAALIVGPWLWAIQSATDGAFINDALGQDLGPKLISGHEGHGAPFGTHLALLPFLFFPAILFLPAGIRAAIRSLLHGDETAVRARLILCFALPIWLIFEIMPTKLPHYTLPVYPALAVLSAWGFLTWRHTPLWARFIGVFLTLITGALGAGLIAGVDTSFGAIHIAASIWPLIVLFMTIATCVAGTARSSQTALAMAVLCGISWQVGMRAITLPSLDNLQISHHLSEAIDQSGLKSSTIPLYSTYTEPSFVFLRRGDLELIDLDTAQVMLDPTRPDRLVVYDTGRMETEYGRALSDDIVLEIEELGCERVRVDGFNYSRGETTSLIAVRTGTCTGSEIEP